jgi:hypothetical protein
MSSDLRKTLLSKTRYDALACSMNPAYSYTLDDQMNPIFCIGCRQHIPDAVSKAGRGLCPECIAKLNQTQASPQVQAPQPPPLAVPPPQAVPTPQAIAPPQGLCPRCSSIQVLDKPVYNTNGTAVALRSGGAVITLLGALTVCLGIGAVLLPIGIVLWVVGVFLPMRRLVSLSHQCHPCGFQWTSAVGLGVPSSSRAPKPPQGPTIFDDPRDWWSKRDLVEKLAVFVLPAVFAIAFLVRTINANYAQASSAASAAPQPAKPVAPTPYEQREAELERQRQAEQQRKDQEEASKRAWIRNEERTRGPRPVPSPWDTICPEVNSWMRANLKDYDSHKIVDGSDVVTYGNDAWCQRLKYRARNSFGAYNLEEKLFVIKNGKVIDVQDY